MTRKKETRRALERRQKYCLTSFLIFLFLTGIANAAATEYYLANYFTLIGLFCSGATLVMALKK